MSSGLVISGPPCDLMSCKVLHSPCVYQTCEISQQNVYHFVLLLTKLLFPAADETCFLFASTFTIFLHIEWYVCEGLEVTFSGNPGHGSAFIQNNAAEKMVS